MNLRCFFGHDNEEFHEKVVVGQFKFRNPDETVTYEGGQPGIYTYWVCRRCGARTESGGDRFA